MLLLPGHVQSEAKISEDTIAASDFQNTEYTFIILYERSVITNWLDKYFQSCAPITSANLQITVIDIIADSLPSEVKFFIGFTGNERIPTDRRILASKFKYVFKINI